MLEKLLRLSKAQDSHACIIRDGFYSHLYDMLDTVEAVTDGEIYESDCGVHVLLVVRSYARLSVEEVYGLGFLLEMFPLEVWPCWAHFQPHWWLWERGQSPEVMFWRKDEDACCCAPEKLPGMSW